jgi:hypothetical protein
LQIAQPLAYDLSFVVKYTFFHGLAGSDLKPVPAVGLLLMNGCYVIFMAEKLQGRQ